MWEFSLNLKQENKHIVDNILSDIKEYVEFLDGIFTTDEQNDYFRILIAVDETNANYVKNLLTDRIIGLICDDLKLKYLDKYLFLPNQDKLGLSAFKKALINFDKETDKFIVKKNLSFDKDIFLESFFYFRLKSLSDKWNELVSLANENKEYLISNESFMDLLKFLIDNLDIYEDEITIVKDNDNYSIYSNGKLLTSVLNEESIIPSVIDLSPQKINLFFKEESSAIDLLKQLFNERITENASSLQNIKNFKLNH